MFVWLSRSMEKIAQSRTDEQVALPPPGWAAKKKVKKIGIRKGNK